ncbi:hypothetical protein [Streptomyces sp. SAJ15]|uniref:hypothetical protein n=1 Tax=Streptomyces sp. SAJ15 TaxID=2011095 RepID=UPI00118561C2|nr:hypothetical protein [Streptomyces sp. SAJ15]TVL91204.1 hypothetical protein CD790_18200 [Streptomyces sp. SAJ15]
MLGPRWVYDGAHDPVLVAELLALVEGRVEAQAQSVSDTVDRQVTRSYIGTFPLGDGMATSAADDREGTELRAPRGVTLRLQRVLRPSPDGRDHLPEGATGQVTGHWALPDGTRIRGLFAVLHTAAAAS